VRTVRQHRPALLWRSDQRVLHRSRHHLRASGRWPRLRGREPPQELRPRELMMADTTTGNHSKVHLAIPVSFLARPALGRSPGLIRAGRSQRAPGNR
jgi:hypothetical protein